MRRAPVNQTRACNDHADACKQARLVVSIGVNERNGATLYNMELFFDAD
jgi:hypothetical protein